MSDSPGGRPPGDTDAGEPVRELAALEHDPPARFVRKVIDGIQQRQATDEVMAFSWWGLTQWAGDMLADLLRLFGVREDKDAEGR